MVNQLHIVIVDILHKKAVVIDLISININIKKNENKIIKGLRVGGKDVESEGNNGKWSSECCDPKTGRGSNRFWVKTNNFLFVQESAVLGAAVYALRPKA